MKKVIEFACSQEKLFEIVRDLYHHGKWPKGYYYSDLGQRDGLGFIYLQIGGMHRRKKKKVPVYDPGVFDIRNEIAGKDGLVGKRHVVGRKTIQADYGSDNIGLLAFGRIGENTATLGVNAENANILGFLGALVAGISKYYPLLSAPSPAVSPGARPGSAAQRGTNDGGSKSTAGSTAQTRGPQLKTRSSLQLLREMRAKAIADDVPILPRMLAMKDADITDKTWKRHDLELWVNWYRADSGREKPEKLE